MYVFDEKFSKTRKVAISTLQILAIDKWRKTNGKRQMTGVFFRIPFAILSIILGLKLSVPSLYVCLVMGGSLSLVMILKGGFSEV